MKDFLDNFASILGVSTLAVLLLAVSHEWGYFWLIGSEFQALLTTSDYLSSAIFWLPFALLFAFGSIEWWRFDEAKNEPKKNWRSWRTWIWPTICAFVIGSILFTSTWPPSSATVYTYLVFAIFVWSKLWKQVPIHVLDEPIQSVARAFVRLGVPAMIGMFAAGWMSASIELDTVGHPDIFHFKGSQGPKLLVTIRSMDKGMILRDPIADRIQFHRWDTIDGFSRIRKEPARSLACYFLDLCPKTRRSPEP